MITDMCHSIIDRYAVSQRRYSFSNSQLHFDPNMYMVKLASKRTDRNT